MPETIEPLDENLYDVLPSRTVPKTANSDNQSIYESRRYSDTGATVVTIPSGINDTSEHLYSSINSDEIYEELPDWTKGYTENGNEYVYFLFLTIGEYISGLSNVMSAGAMALFGGYLDVLLKVSSFSFKNNKNAF